MIVDPNHNYMPEMANANDSLIDSPPSYDAATDGYPADKNKPRAVVAPTVNKAQSSTPYSTSASTSTQPRMVPSPTVYNYTNPRTGERVVSLLPPDHPEMICLQEGAHVPHTKFGLLGILAAVFWFPLGIGLCLLDRRVRCSRCGLHIEDGICG